MKIIKYKKKNKDKYIVFFEDDSSLELYEDVILKHDLLLKKEIIADDYNKVLYDNKRSDTYYGALSYIKKRMRSKTEIEEYLKKKDYLVNDIENTINRLYREGLLNDERYVVAYINDKLNFSNSGLSVIKRDLLKLNFSEELINKHLDCIDLDIIKVKLTKMIERSIKTNHHDSVNGLKKKIINKYINMGYSIDIIKQIVDNLDFNDDTELLKKEYQKLIKKYEKKYDKNKLQIIIKQKLFQKGFNVSEIEKISRN